MAKKTALTVLVVIVLTAVFYVSAQAQGPDNRSKNLEEAQKRYQEILGNFPLSQSAEDTEGNSIWSFPNHPSAQPNVSRDGIIRIEMQDGSIQEIQMNKVKKITIEQEKTPTK